MSAAKRRPKSNSPGKNVRGEIRISARKLARLLEAQTRADSLLRKFARQQTRARAARLLFKPLQRERGKLIFVGLNGRRIPPGANRKGYALYVTKTGKKRLVVRKALKNPYAPRKLSEVKLSGAGNLRRVEKVFERSRLEKISRGKVTRASRARKEKASGAEKLWEKKSGEAVAGEYSERFRPPAGKAFDEKAVSQMARSIARAFASQKSRRLFLITALAWVRGEYGDDVVQVQFSLGRSERYFFEVNPVQFVRKSFYAAFAQQLAYFGYVTSGSANHIRRSVGSSTTQRVWEKYHQKDWSGHDFNIVDLVSLEWKIERT